jgi:hypothetical protein
MTADTYQRQGASRICLLVAAGLVTGCLGPSTVNVAYRHGSYVHKLTPVRVGVYQLDDDRPGWPAKAAMRMFDGGSMLHTEGDKTMSAFVSEALRQELVATGLRVAAEAEFDRAFIYATPASMSAARVDRVVVGRINYLGMTGPVPKSAISGASVAAAAVVPISFLPAVVALEQNRVQQESEGVSFDADDVPSKAYVDLDLQVVEPGTGRILWARTTRLKRNAGFLSGVVADTVAIFLSETLRMALQQAIWRADFLAALGATVVTGKVAGR